MTTRSRLGHIRSICTACLFLTTALCTPLWAADDDPQAVRAAIAARAQRLQNLIVSYESQVNHTPPRELLDSLKQEKAGPQGISFVPVAGTRHSRHEFSFLDGRARYDANLLEYKPVSAEYAVPGELVQTVVSISPDRAEQLWVTGDGNPPRGTVGDKIEPQDSYIDTALGMRGWDSAQWLGKQDWEKAELQQQDDDEVVLQISNPRALETFRFRKSLGYALVAYERRAGPEEHAYIEITCDDFVKQDGLMLPRSIRGRRMNWSTGQAQVVLTAVLSVQKYRLNDPKNTPKRYSIVWPKDTLLTNERTRVAVTVKDGPPAAPVKPPTTDSKTKATPTFSLSLVMVICAWWLW